MLVMSCVSWTVYVMKTGFTPTSLTRLSNSRQKGLHLENCVPRKSPHRHLIRNNVKHATNVMLNRLCTGRGGLSVKGWRGVHRHGVALTSKRFIRSPRNVVADTVHRDEAFVIHRRVRTAYPFEVFNHLYLGVVEGNLHSLTRPTSWKGS